MAKNTINDHALLSAALEGLEIQKARLEEQIRGVRSMLGQRAKRSPVAAASSDAEQQAPKKRRKRRKLSAEARARIAAAQKKRWSEFRKKKEG